MAWSRLHIYIFGLLLFSFLQIKIYHDVFLGFEVEEKGKGRHNVELDSFLLSEVDYWISYCLFLIKVFMKFQHFAFFIMLVGFWVHVLIMSRLKIHFRVNIKIYSLINSQDQFGVNWNTRQKSKEKNADWSYLLNCHNFFLIKNKQEPF